MQPGLDGDQAAGVLVAECTNARDGVPPKPSLEPHCALGRRAAAHTNSVTLLGNS